MEAYLDNSATTRCSKAAADMVYKLLTEDYGNPSSLHMKGVEAENYINDAKKKIAKTLRVQDKEILFTSGGTESNNTAIIGAAMANKRAGRHIITSSVEHASVLSVMQFLEEQGFEITYMHVNNEIGAVMPIEEAGAAIKEKNPATLFHVDAIQSYGKLEIRPKRMNIDMLSVSGHKIHGPKGSGFLYIKDKTKIKPIIYGGGQQKGMRSGTENVPAYAGLGVAAEEIYTDFDKKTAHMYELRDHFIESVQRIDGVSVNGRTDHTNAPHVVSVSVDGVRAEVMLHTLEDRQIYVSAGSACSSNKPAISSTLKSIGLKPSLLDSTIRFSFCVNTTQEEIDYAVSVMAEVIPMLRRYTRR